MTQRTPSPRIILAIVALAAACLLVAGCGGSSGSSNESAATTSTTSSDASAASFTDCLKKNGVDNFDPTQQGGTAGEPPQGVDMEKVQKAMQACGNLAPQGGFGGALPGGSSNAGSKKFQQCMKDNGVDSFGPGTQGSQSQADRAKIQKARKACASLAPQGGFPQGAPGGGNSNFTAFSRCMRRNGAPLPGAGSTATVDTTSATYVKAQKKCQPLLTGGQSQ
jgi:hypothetical protein